MNDKLSRDVNKIGLRLNEITLKKSINEGKWISPFDDTEKSIENAVFDNYKCKGWKGYSGEGGLILNLIKAMSFNEIQYRHRSMYVEAIYAQNVAFEEDRFSADYLLTNVKNATKKQIESNYNIGHL